MGMSFRSNGAATALPGSFTWDIGLNLIWGDASFSQILGIPAETMNAGISILQYLDLIHPEDRPKLAKKVHQSILKACSCSETLRVVRKDGDETWVTVEGRYYRIQDGLPTLCSGTLTLITPVSDRSLIANRNDTGSVNFLGQPS